ncbi:MAG TPA: hypothetical protein VHX16_15245 [Chloroflexota bacterium]|nr:hypothetical protein [Chloroflexota bacterium]
MSPVMRWGLLAGIVVMVVDTISALITQGFPADSDTAQTVQMIDLGASVGMYALAGFRSGRALGIIRAGAEAGVLAGVLAGFLAAALAYVIPGPDGSAPNPIGDLSLNIALGGVLGLFNGWLGSRIPETPRR